MVIKMQLIKTDNPKKVMIVGAGAGGLEAAVTAAACGHHVEIFEKDSQIGGQARNRYVNAECIPQGWEHCYRDQR